MRLFEVDTHNQVVDGELLRDVPAVWVWTDRYQLGGQVYGYDHFALEAWERQTMGGLKVPCLPGYPYAHAIETPTLTCAFIADFGPSEWT